jgi:hypothetical protein
MRVTVGGNLGADVAAVGADATIATNAATANGDFGILTSPSVTTAAVTFETAVTFTNSRIVAGSVVELTINKFNGTIVTNGIPTVILKSKTTGSCSFLYGNLGANALSAGTLEISYRVYNA